MASGMPGAIFCAHLILPTPSRRLFDGLASWRRSGAGINRLGRSCDMFARFPTVISLICILFSVAAPLPVRAADAPVLAVETAKADRLREDLRQMIAAARDRVFPALVNISVVTLNYYEG